MLLFEILTVDVQCSFFHIFLCARVTAFWREMLEVFIRNKQKQLFIIPLQCVEFLTLKIAGFLWKIKKTISRQIEESS